jgi:outer membrane protein OmpA-like peptidoglycan-associated protein
MRNTLALVVLCLVPVSAAAQPKLTLDIAENDIDVERRTIHFALGTVVAEAEIQVFSPEGVLLHSGREQYPNAAPHARLAIGWPDLGDKGQNFRIELKFTDSGGNWVTFEVIRFYVEIPHEEIEFETGQAEITPQQRPKLDKPLALLEESVSKYAALMHVNLYVAGHTDTVGQAQDNQRLSERRAQSIAKFFVEHGLKSLPIYVRGFGEGALAVKTADNVAERRNRRAQYIISSFVPPIAGPGTWRRVQ